MSDSIDSALRQFVMLKLANMGERFQMLDDGTIILSDTQAWMTIYDQLMRSLDITKHWSVVWIKSADDWLDEMGQQCLAANFAAVRRGMKIKRLVIIEDDLWPKSDYFPHESIRQWLNDQHVQGMWLGMVRESVIARESELLADFGIYGSQAVGTQTNCERSHLVRFELSFDEAKVQADMARWDRLKQYAVSYFALLDQLEIKE